jgi:hypothetical protein
VLTLRGLVTYYVLFFIHLDEACAIAGIEAAGLKADAGQDAADGDAGDFGLEAFDCTCYQES